MIDISHMSFYDFISKMKWKHIHDIKNEKIKSDRKMKKKKSNWKLLTIFPIP